MYYIYVRVLKLMHADIKQKNSTYITLDMYVGFSFLLELFTV